MSDDVETFAEITALRGLVMILIIHLEASSGLRRDDWVADVKQLIAEFKDDPEMSAGTDLLKQVLAVFAPRRRLRNRPVDPKALLRVILGGKHSPPDKSE